MRHGDKVNNLGRKTAHRKALLSNLATQLFTYKRIFTTLAKARALRIYAEPLVTRAKTDSTHNRRHVFSFLQDKAAVTELFTVIGDKVAARPGGYTRVIKMPRRVGDAAEMAMIELVDFNETYTKDVPGDARKTRRSRRGSGTGSAPAAPAASATPAEAIETLGNDNDTDAAAAAADADIAADTADDAVASTPAAMDEMPAADDTTPLEDAAATDEKAEGAGA